jgi:hypothetical protein
LLKKVFSILLVLSLQSCFLFRDSNSVDPEDPVTDVLPSFNENPQAFDVENGRASEASGVAPSRSFPDHVWVIEDSGNEAGLHLLGANGAYKNFSSMGLQNRDWEDIATGTGPEPNQNYVYIADIGDNILKNKEYYIYRVPEPSINQTEIINFDTFKFHYPNNISINCETLLFDPLTKDLFIIAKDNFNVEVFRLPYPQKEDQEAEFMGTIPYWLIVGGDISADGSEILLKSYLAVHYWKRKKDETVFQALSRARDLGLPYIKENQGEAISWDAAAKGYFTISENQDSGLPQQLFYYTKK